MQIGHNLSHIKIPIKKQHTTKEILRIRKSDQPKPKPKKKRKEDNNHWTGIERKRNY